MKAQSEISRNKSDGIIKSSLLLSIFVCIGKVLGFIKQSVIAWAFGSGAATDIYFAADSYIAMFGQVMGNSVAPSVLTEYVQIKEKDSKDRANLLVKNCLIIFVLFSIIIVGINVVFSRQISEVLGIAYTVSQREELAKYIIYLCPVIVFTTIIGVMQGVLDANRCFIPSKMVSLFFSISIIISVCFLRKYCGIQALLIGFMTGYFLHTIYMVICGKKIIRSSQKIAIAKVFTEHEKNVLLKFVPLVIGNSIVDISQITDKIIASSLSSGSVSALYYGQIISSDLVNAVVITSIGTVLLPNFTSKVSKGIENNILVNEIRNIMLTLMLIAMMLCGLYIVEGRDLIEFVFQRGNFTQNNTILVANVAMAYAFGFVFMAGREILVKAHYAYQDTKTPMINGGIGVIVNIMGSIILSKIIGVGGISLATSISLATVFIISSVTLEKHVNERIINRKCLISLMKIFIAVGISVLMGIVARQSLIKVNCTLRATVVSSGMVFVFGLIELVLRENTFKYMTNTVLKKIKK